MKVGKYIKNGIPQKFRPRSRVLGEWCANVHIIPILQDNYSYLLLDRKKDTVACIDPGYAPPIIEATQKLGLKIELILCTHKHDDHVGGVLDLWNAYGCKVVGPTYEHINGVTHHVKHGDIINFGNLSINVIHTPCHTAGHVCYYVDNVNSDKLPILFSGDTLFAGGCGRFFEGDANQMLSNMDTFSSLPDTTRVYCGHEYTLSNIQFIHSIDPLSCHEYYENAKDKRKRNIPTIPTTIEDEKKYNIFMRCREKHIQNLLQCSDSVETMNKLRNMKNSF
jgi:hydroxyacylglutathione hydrolase